MKMNHNSVDEVLAEAQALLWSGSLHEVDQAHNLISNLIRDRMALKNLK